MSFVWFYESKNSQLKKGYIDSNIEESEALSNNKSDTVRNDETSVISISSLAIIINNDSKCNNCNKTINPKVILECDHTICENCTLLYLNSRFQKSESYEYAIPCKICMKKIKLSNLILL